MVGNLLEPERRKVLSASAKRNTGAGQSGGSEKTAGSLITTQAVVQWIDPKRMERKLRENLCYPFDMRIMT